MKDPIRLQDSFRNAARLKQLVRSLEILGKGVTRSDVEDPFQKDNADVQPPKSSVNPRVCPIRHVGNGSRDEHIRVELKMVVVDLDEELIGRDILPEPREIQRGKR